MHALLESLHSMHGQEPIKHEVQPGPIFARDYSSSAIFTVMHERKGHFNWFIAVTSVASATLNDSKWDSQMLCKMSINNAHKEPWQAQ